MGDSSLVKRLAGNSVDIEMAAERLEALEMAVSWLLARQQDDSAIKFLALQANELEGAGTVPGVVTAIDALRESASYLRALPSWPQDTQKKEPAA